MPSDLQAASRGMETIEFLNAREPCKKGTSLKLINWKALKRNKLLKALSLLSQDTQPELRNSSKITARVQRIFLPGVICPP